MNRLFLLNSFRSFILDYFPYIIVGLMILVFVIIVLIAASKKRKPLKYVSDDIDRTVDALAQEKAAQKKAIDEQAEMQAKAPLDDVPQSEQEQTNVDVPSDEQQSNESKDEQIEKDFDTPKHSEQETAENEIAKEEEITVEIVDEPSPQLESKPVRNKTISYRILYDKETKTWEVRKDNAKRVIRRVKTKKEALDIARELCEKQDVNLVVHKKDGKFQKKH